MESAERRAKWAYQGIWAILTKWFKVPAHPPSLPAETGVTMRSFRPSEGFLRYMRFYFWIGLVIISIVILAGLIFLSSLFPPASIYALPLILILAIILPMVAYLAIHLRYDTTWYVMTDRSLRIRRGIWVIREMTFTFENVQNVVVLQGPLQRFFGISNIAIETAGGGSSESSSGETQANTAHQGLIEGVAKPDEIRELILQQLRTSTSAGLGDEDEHHRASEHSWPEEHLGVLTDIRDSVRMLAGYDRSR